jgi:hypothetical protein
MTVDQMLRSMPASEIAEWMVYFDLLKNPPIKELSEEERSQAIKSALLKGKRK